MASTIRDAYSHLNGFVPSLRKGLLDVLWQCNYLLHKPSIIQDSKRSNPHNDTNTHVLYFCEPTAEKCESSCNIRRLSCPKGNTSNMIIFSIKRHVILRWHLCKTEMKQAAVHPRWYGLISLAKTPKSKK